MADTEEELKADCSDLLFQQRADKPPSSGPLLSSSSSSVHCGLRTYYLHHMRQSAPLKEFRAECGAGQVQVYEKVHRASHRGGGR